MPRVTGSLRVGEVFEPTGKFGHRTVSLLEEQAPHFEIWVDPLFDSAKKLEDQAIVVGDGRIAPAFAPGTRLARRSRGPPPFAVRAGRRGKQLARRRLDAPPALDHVEQEAPEAHIGEPVANQAPLVPCLFTQRQFREHPPRGPRMELFGCTIAQEGEREHVTLGLPLGVLDVDNGDARVQVFGEGDGLYDAGQLGHPSLCRQPFAAKQVGREDLVERGAVRAGNQRRPVAVDHEMILLAEVARELRASRFLEGEPIEQMRAQRERVGAIGHLGKRRATEQLDQREALVLREVDLDVLHEARQVGDHQDVLVFERTDERHHAVVVGVQKLDRPAPEGSKLLAQSDEPSHPPQERMAVALLRFDVDGLVVVLVIDHHRQNELLRVGAREAGIHVAAPLHRGAHPVAVTEVHVVAHPDLVAVVENRRAGEREQAGRSSTRWCGGCCRAGARVAGGSRG